MTATTSGGDRAGRGTGLPFGPRSAIEVVSWSDAASWDTFVEAAADARAEHLWFWGHVAERVYGHRAVRLAAVRDGRLQGVLPLVSMRSRLLGRTLVSMPFADYGGVCTAGDEAADRALVGAAIAMAEQEGVTLELRHFGDRAIGLPCSREKATLVMDLGEDEAALWRSVPGERRRQVRKGRERGLSTSLRGPEALPALYRVHAENMRDHGSPVHARRFFAEIMAGLGPRARILTVEEGGSVLGAAMLVFFRDTVSAPWVASFRAARSRGANQVLYWDALRLALAAGYRAFDFGRSSPGTGPFAFKREWGARPIPLSWHYFPEGAGAPGESVQRLSWAPPIWRRLPIGLTNLIGPRLRRSISN